MSLHGAVVVIIVVVVVDRGEREERQAWQGARGNDFSNSAAENGRKGSFRMEMTERGGEESPSNPLKSQLFAVRGWETSERTEEERVGLLLPRSAPSTDRSVTSDRVSIQRESGTLLMIRQAG